MGGSEQRHPQHRVLPALKGEHLPGLLASPSLLRLSFRIRGGSDKVMGMGGFLGKRRGHGTWAHNRQLRIETIKYRKGLRQKAGSFTPCASTVGCSGQGII